MKRTLSCFVAAATILGLAGVPLLGGLLGDTPAGASNPSVESQVLALVNSDRTTRGLPALAVDPSLVTIARAWSDHLLATGTLSHNYNLPNQISPQASGWGENVGMGPSATSINSAWLSSPAHYANVVGNYNFVGVGVSTRSDGTQFVTVDYELVPTGAPMAPQVAIASAPPAAPTGPPCQGTNPASTPNASAASGDLVMGPDGGIFTAGRAPYLGSAPGLHVATDAVGLAMTPDQHGYWELGRDGAVFSFGTARYHGSPAGLGVPIDAAAIAPTPTGNGYWVLGRDGGVFAFGDAGYHGSPAGLHIPAQSVSIAATPTGQGYWVVADNGGVFSFGDAAYHGSPAGAQVGSPAGAQVGSPAGAQVAEPPVSIASTRTGHGYWVLGARGGVYSFGDAPFYGSLPGTGCPTAGGVALVPTITGHGYEILAVGGPVLGFGDAPHFPQVVGGDVRGLAVTH